MDTSFDLRSFFSDRKNILMTIGVILLLILIPVLPNTHHTPAEDKGIIPASKLVDVYLKDPQKAEKYVGKKVRLNEVPISVDNDAGETVLYTVQGTKTDEMVLFTFTADTDQNRETVRSLDPTRKVNVTGQIESVSSGNGYQVRILTVNGTIRDDFSEVPETVTEAPAAETWQGETMSEDVENTVPETTAAAPDTDSGKITVQTKGSHTYLIQDGSAISDYTGLYSCKIGGKKKLYFFQNGVYRPKHNGIEEYQGTTYMVYHGAVKTDFTGTYVLDGASYSVVKGVVQE